jgi:hypothetical protein
MFSCCSSKSILTSVVSPVLLDTKAKEPPPGPVPNIPLPKVQPPTPNLTPTEIIKIQTNLVTVKAFVKDLWLQQGLIINEVWAQLQSQANISKRSDDNIIKNSLENFLSVAVFIDGMAALIPGPQELIFGAVAIILSSVSSLLSTNGSDMSSITGGADISNYIASQSENNNSHYYALVQVIDYMHDHPNDCRDYIFTIKTTNKTATLRTLIDNTFSTGTYYDNWLRLAGRMYRRSIVLPEMAKPQNQFLDLYFVADWVNEWNSGYVFEPCAVDTGVGTERLKQLDHDNAGTNAVIWSNREIIETHPEYGLVDQKGTSDTDYTKSYLEATGKFIAKFPSAYVFPWAMTNNKVYAQKYFIMEGFQKIKDDSRDYTLCNGHFLNWLFIDDGVGNITNVDGVAFRYEVLRTGLIGIPPDIFLHGRQISDTILDQHENWIDTSMNYIYGPQSSKDTNQQFHVYTGDLLLKNLPQ